MCLAVVAAVFVCFFPALRAGFVSWDDPMNLTENAAYRGLSRAHLGWMFTTTYGGQYKPLTWLSYGLDYTLWGMTPAGYHLSNVILHAANALVCFFVIRRLLGPGASAAAACGALFFAIHPLRVESVAWVSARKDVLSGLFYLLSVLAYLHVPAAHGRARMRWLVGSVGGFLLGLLAKPWGMGLPLVLLVLDAYPLRRFTTEPPRRLLVEKLPYVALSLGALLLTVEVARPVEGMRTLAEYGLAARLAQAAYGLCFYVWKTIVPLGLSPLYVLEPHLDPARPRYVGALVAVLGVTGILLALRRPRWALSAWVIYVALVSPMLGFVQTGPQIAADRFTYLSCLPWAVLLAAGIDRAGLPAMPPAVLGLAVLGVLTFRQTQVWTDSRTLWEHALRLDPENYVAHLNLGIGRTDNAQAVADFTAAIRLRPGLAMAWYDRGNRRRELGDLDGAIADFTEAIRLRPRDPMAWHNRGWIRARKGDWAEAVRDYESALQVSPPGWPGRGNIEANLAAARARLGRP